MPRNINKAEFFGGFFLLFDAEFFRRPCDNPEPLCDETDDRIPSSVVWLRDRALSQIRSLHDLEFVSTRLNSRRFEVEINVADFLQNVFERFRFVD